MNASLIPPTKRGPTLRTLCLCLLLLGLLPSLRAGQFGLFTYERVEDTIEITEYPQDAVGAVEIPAVIEGLPVTSLGQSAFTGCTNLTRVTIPDTVSRIGITDNRLAHRVSQGTFSGCTQLAEVTLPNGVTTLGHRVFSGCTSLFEVTIPDTVTALGDEAFSGCKRLTRIALSNGLTTIGTDYLLTSFFSAGTPSGGIGSPPGESFEAARP